MITNSYDVSTPAKINPGQEKNIQCDVCIITFSNHIVDYIVKQYVPEKVAELPGVTGIVPLYRFAHNGKTFAVYQTYVGGAASVAMLEGVIGMVSTNKFIVFGGSGCLNREYARGKIMVPTYAYRDEGTSYHYAAPQDYIQLPHAEDVARFMREKKIPCAQGRTWSTDAFFRETEREIALRKAEGCISVEMECAAFQALCTFRNVDLYYFLNCGDLLDAPEWDMRMEKGKFTGTQHDPLLFEIALELAHFIGD